MPRELSDLELLLARRRVELTREENRAMLRERGLDPLWEVVTNNPAGDGPCDVMRHLQAAPTADEAARRIRARFPVLDVLAVNEIDAPWWARKRHA